MSEALRAIVEAHHARLPASGASVLDLIHLCALARAQARRLAMHGSDGTTGELERLVRAVELLAGTVEQPGRELRTVVGATLDTVDRLLDALGAPKVVASSAASLAPPLAARPRPVSERAYLVLASGGALAMDASGRTGAEVELAGSRVVCAARTEAGIVSAHEDGTLVCAHASAATVARTASASAPGRTWAAVAGVRRAGERCIAAVDSAGVVELRSPDLMTVIDSFRMDAGVPLAMLGDGEALAVAFERGPLRRVRPVSPQRWEAFVAFGEGAGVRSMTAARSTIVVLTDAGHALVFDGREPRALPRACDLAGHRAVCAAAFDDDSAVIADEAGTLWRVGCATGRTEAMAPSLSGAPVAIARARDVLVAAYEGATVELVPLREARSGAPRIVTLSAPVAALFA